VYRLFIEKTGADYLRVSLQRRQKTRWKTQEVEYCYAGNQKKFAAVVSGYASVYGISAGYIVDTRVDYGSEPWLTILVNEVKLRLEFYTWQKQLKRMQREASVLHYASGSSRATRRKYWVMTDYKGRPLLMTSLLKDEYKRKGYYDKRVSALDLNKECIWCTDSLYD
jgi:hypothetical protein